MLRNVPLSEKNHDAKEYSLYGFYLIEILEKTSLTYGY